MRIAFAQAAASFAPSASVSRVRPAASVSPSSPAVAAVTSSSISFSRNGGPMLSICESRCTRASARAPPSLTVSLASRPMPYSARMMVTAT